jgi:hypothetical protein
VDDHRGAFAAIVLVLRSDFPLGMLPSAIGRSGLTCWRTLSDGQVAASRRA